MILIKSGRQDKTHFDAKVVFASQLAARGHRVLVDEMTVPSQLNRSEHYSAAPYLGPVNTGELSSVIIIGAETIDAELLTTLRTYDLPLNTSVAAIGHFSRSQPAGDAGTKIAHAINREPNVFDLTHIQTRSIMVPSCVPQFGECNGTSALTSSSCNLFLFVPPDLLEEPATYRALAGFQNISGLEFRVITNALGLKLIRDLSHEAIPAFNYLEFSPIHLGQIADVAAYFGPGKPAERIAIFASNLLQRGGIFVDCSREGRLAASGAPIMLGTPDLGDFVDNFSSQIFLKREEIGQRVIEDPWLPENALNSLEKVLKLTLKQKPSAARRSREAKVRHLFIPTNGVGIGHAQRSSVIASHMNPKSKRVFLTFPSCVRMLQSKGFDCLPLVQKSDFHRNTNANDVFNYLTMRKFVQPTDQLVFDGGYVFDSVFRTIVEKQTKAVWIRRGVWKESKINPKLMERARVFNNIVVPGEAFEELTDGDPSSKKATNVGPIVQDQPINKFAIEGLRNRLKERFDHDFDRLVITMLGAGFRGNRSVHLNTICSILDKREACLNLILAWPNAVISPTLYTWKNSRVVRATNALALCQASDFVISASGYNTFHELLYHKVPTIFVPQEATLDDQDRRARAASDRLLAVTVPATEKLRLGRELCAFFDEGKAEEIRPYLESYKFPGLGNKEAAKLIERWAAE